MTSPVDSVVEALRVAGKQTKRLKTGGWVAQCPAHDDRNPSLTVGEGRDGKALVHCHAGCPHELVIAALGMNVADLFATNGNGHDAALSLMHWRAWREALNQPPASPKPDPIRQAVAEYVYLDADRQPDTKVVRYDLVDPGTGEIIGKTFTQHAADGHGGWKRGLDGHQPPLYRLPQVLEAVAAGTPVIVVEGEKDADTAVNRLGLVATCNPMGAGKWRDHHTAALAGATVILIPDLDPPGLDHAHKIHADLTTAGTTVVTLAPATGKDLTDHVDAGNGLVQLVPHNLTPTEPGDNQAESDPPPPTRAEILLANELATQRARRDAKRLLDNEDATAAFREPPWRPTLVEELAIPDEPVTYTVDQLQPTGSNVLVTAQYKTGKTTLTNDLTRSLADGKPFLGRFPVATLNGRVALFNYEVDERQYRRWLRDLHIEHPEQVAVLNLRGYRLPLTSRYVEDWIVRWLTDRAVQVWIVDPFARAFTGCGDENSNSDVGQFLDTLDVIKDRANVSDLVLPTHTGRMTLEEGAERARGATRLDDWADVRWLLTKDDQEDRFFRATGRDVDVPEEKLIYNEATRSVTLGGGNRGGERRRRVSEALLYVIREQPGIGTRELRSAIRELLRKVENESIDDALQAAVRAGQIRVESARRVGEPNRHYIVTWGSDDSSD